MVEPRKVSRVVAPTLLAAVLVAVGALFLLEPALVREFTQFNAVNSEAEGLIDESLERNLVTFLSVSAIKAVVGILEGSSIGVGFDLEVGDLIEPAFDYIDFIWRIFLYALMALSFYKLLFETELLGIGFPLIGLGLVLRAVAELPTAWRPQFRRWGRVLMLAGILVSYIVPLSLLGTNAVSEGYLANVKAKNEARITGVQRQFDEAGEDVLALREKVSILNPTESVEAIRQDASLIATQLADSLWDSMFAFLTFVLILIVELVVLPFASAFLLYKIAAIATRRFAEGGRPVPPPPQSPQPEVRKRGSS